MEEPSFNGPPETQKAGKAAPTDFPSKVFLTKDGGLRAGWRLLLYFIFFIVFSFCLGQLLRPAGHTFSPSFQFIAESVSLAAAGLAAWVMSVIERRPLGAYGLPVRIAFGKLFWQGCLFGLFEICALVGGIAVLGGYSFGDLAEHGSQLVGWALFWAAFFLIVGFFEEFLFRGYALYTLGEGIGFWPAAVLLSVLFGAVHKGNAGENWIGVFGVVLVGFFWSFTLRRTGNLWFAVGMHAAFDFGETFLFSVPDSGMVSPGHLSNASLHGPAWLTGGTPGPEASVIDFAILILFFFVFDRLYPARRENHPPYLTEPSAQ
jgi:uncharacterized protein